MDSQEINEALRPIRAAYYTSVRAIAEEAFRQPEEERSDFAHERVDGSQWVIYTFKARLVAVVSDNVDACEDATGESAETDTARAYWAMRADVEELLNNEYFVKEMQEKGEE